MIMSLYFALVLFICAIEFEAYWMVLMVVGCFFFAEYRYDQLKDRIAKLEKERKDDQTPG